MNFYNFRNLFDNIHQNDGSNMICSNRYQSQVTYKVNRKIQRKTNLHLLVLSNANKVNWSFRANHVSWKYWTKTKYLNVLVAHGLGFDCSVVRTRQSSGGERAVGTAWPYPPAVTLDCELSTCLSSKLLIFKVKSQLMVNEYIKSGGRQNVYVL